MYDHMFVETLIISSSFFAVAIILVASVIFWKKRLTGCQPTRLRFMERHQLRTGDTQIILRIHNHGFFQQTGVKRDFIKTLEQERVGHQCQIGMEAKRRNGAKNAGGQGIDFGRACERRFYPPKMAGKLA